MTQGQAHAYHRATWIDEARRLAEIGTEDVVGRQFLFRGFVEGVEDVDEELEPT